MTFASSIGRVVALSLPLLLGGAETRCQITVAAPASRLAGDWRSSPLVAIPLGEPIAADGVRNFKVLGAAPPATRLDRMLLLLEPSAAQQQALTAKLATLNDSSSTDYHRRLTPAEFAAAYGNLSSDVAAVVEWLRSEGFDVGSLPSGLGWVEFSGTAGQVEQAFQARLNMMNTPGGSRVVLATAISVPAALRPLIHGLVSLDGVLAEAASTAPQPITSTADELAVATSLNSAEAASPRLLAQLIHLDSLHQSGLLGTGQSIAIATRSNVSAADVAAFRSAFSLPANLLKVVSSGTDPGRTADEAEADLAASWAGAAAPKAQIVLVPGESTAATDGVDLSLASIVDRQLAGGVVIGYSSCEAAIGEAHRAFYAALYRQAAAQGISVIAASGNSGAAACHQAGSDAEVASGFGVNALAATPWNTAVGVAAAGSSGVADGLSAWSPMSSAEPAYAGGGGSSTVYPAPSWQAGVGARQIKGATAVTTELAKQLSSAGLAAGFRLLPDLSLPTGVDSGVNRGLAFCFAGSTSMTGCRLVRAGGSSAAAAVFAGVAALLAEKYGPQGNLTPRLYTLGSTFDDVRQGDAQLTCAVGSPGCDAGRKIGFAAGAGYDLATGLGSVNAEALLRGWPAPALGSSAVAIDFSLSPVTANSYYNPSATVTFAATVTDQSDGGTPTGTVTFINSSTGLALSSASTASLANSSGANVASVTLNLGSVFSTQGSYNVAASYSGDSSYASATSSPLPMTIQKSGTTLTIQPSTTSPVSGATMSAVVTIAVSSTSAAPAGSQMPTGQITLNVAGGPVAGSYSGTLSTTAGVTTATFSNVTVPGVAQFTLQAQYAGDNNYAASTSPSVTINVSKGTTTTALAVTGTPATGQLNTTWTLTAIVTPSAISPAPTGTVTFSDGGVSLGVAGVASSSSGYQAVLSVSLANNVSHSIVAAYSGDTNWLSSTSSASLIAANTLSDSVTLAISNLQVSSGTGYPTAAPGQVAILTATVTPSAIPPATAVEQYPTGYVDFYLVVSTGNTLIGRSLLARVGTTDQSAAAYSAAMLPGGQDTIVAVYEGDAFYNSGISNSITLGIEDFTITADASNPATNLNIVQGGAGSATFDINGLGGFNGEIQVVCAVPTQDLPLTCTPTPQQVVPNATVTFVVKTFNTNATVSSSRSHHWQQAEGGTALALLGFILLPFGRRVRIFAGQQRSRRFVILLLLLVALSATGIGCNNVALSGSSGPNGGTPLGVATLKITASDYLDNTVFSRSVYVTVNVLAQQ